MERDDVAYIIHTTPKYFYLLPLHLGLIYRYSPHIHWDIWIATEEPNHPLLKSMKDIYGVYIFTLTDAESGFLNSRAATFAHFAGLLQQSFVQPYNFIIPVQEDFLLERFVDAEAIEETFALMESDTQIQSVRWMPCPGPAAADELYKMKPQWKLLHESRDTYLFTFQMCVWRPAALSKWYTRLCAQFNLDNPGPLTENERRSLEIRANYAENRQGQEYFKNWHMSNGEKHVAWVRRHQFPNAVYLSPWPYRPTAVIGGELQPWAIELSKREGFPL
jgi:hypothetical protein